MGNPTDAPRLHFAPVPPQPHRRSIPGATAELCLRLWAAGLQSLRRLSDGDFSSEVAGNTSLVAFVRSYISLDELKTHVDDNDDWVYATAITTDAAGTLRGYVRRGVKVVVHRAGALGCSKTLLTPCAFVKLAALFTGDGARSLMKRLYAADEALAKAYVQEHIRELVSLLASAAGNGKGKGGAADAATMEADVASALQELSYLVMALPDVADVVMADHGFFEALADTYAAYTATSMASAAEELRRVLFSVVVAAVQAQRYSALMDFLFSVTEDAKGSVGVYVSAVVASTPVLDRLSAVDAAGFANRWATVLQRLQRMNAATATTSKLSRLPRRRAKQMDNTSSPAGISELREMFPHIDQATLHAVLASVNGDVEAATITLLDGIPDTSTAPTATTTQTTKDTSDELDSLSVPTSRLYLGKRAASTADAMLSDRTAAPSKDRILAALQSFDSDDDERDDTYDADDIGGAIDRGDTADEQNAAAAAGTTVSDEERILYKALVENPGIFARDAVTRRGIERRKLREATGMTDEAVEGWKVMLDRDGGKRLQQLEIRFSRESTAAAEQPVIARTAWRRGDDDEDGDGSGEGTSRGYGGGRGGRGGRGRGGGPNDRNVRGQQRDHAPVVREGGEGPRVVKKTSKARGEHSRKVQSAARDRQRTKKMSKGM